MRVPGNYWRPVRGGLSAPKRLLQIWSRRGLRWLPASPLSIQATWTRPGSHSNVRSELAPNVSATHAALGSVLLSQNQTAAALQELTRAHALDPGDVSIDLNLARAKVEAGGFMGALPLFRSALASSPPPVLSEDESLAYAKALTVTGDLTSAENTLRNALATAPDSAQLNDALGTLLAQGGQLDQALPFFRHAIAEDPTFARAQYHLGAALLAGGQPQDALAPLEAAATSTPNSFDVELQLGLALSAAS